MVVLKHRRKAFQPAGGSFIMDTITANDHLSVSIDQLYGSATKCMELRRDGGSPATQDFGFSGGQLDDAAITTWAGGNNIFIRTWYEQETDGAGTNLQNTVDANQPSLVLFGGRYMPYFDGSTSIPLKWLDTTASLTISQPNQYFYVTEDLESGSNHRRIFDTGAGAQWHRCVATNTFYSIYSSSQQYKVVPRPWSLAQDTITFDGTSTDWRRDSVTQTLNTSTQGTNGVSSTLTLGCTTTHNIEMWYGYIPEFICVDELSTGDRDLLEADQQSRLVP